MSLVLFSESDEIAAAILMVVPELDASISGVCSFISPELSTVTLDPSAWIFAPKFLHALIVAIVSLDNNTFLIWLFPFANVAKNMAMRV